MFTKKQLVVSIGLIVIGNTMIVTAANADDLSTVNLQGSTMVGPLDAVNFDSTANSSVNALFGSISIPPGMNIPGSGTSGTGSSSSGSSSTADGGTSGTGNDSSTTGIVTVADIAEYFVSSIDQSLDALDTSNIAQKPRRIVRRRNSASCPNPQISGSSENLDDLLTQSEQFLEEVEQVKPENSIW